MKYDHKAAGVLEAFGTSHDELKAVVVAWNEAMMQAGNLGFSTVSQAFELFDSKIEMSESMKNYLINKGLKALSKETRPDDDFGKVLLQLLKTAQQQQSSKSKEFGLN